MALDSKIEALLDALLKAIHETDCFKDYESYRQKVLSDSELLQRIKRTRVIRERLSNMNEYERNGQEAENLVDEYDRLCDITDVHEFSIKELEYCDLYRQVMAKLASNFEIEL